MAVKRLVLYFLLCCQISGIIIFLKGFFPLKKNSPGFSIRNVNGSVVHSKFDRLIVVMIDALRADFVFGNNSYMSFTNGLITHGNTYSFKAHSNPPTVTMPRIKAITTGTIPGFIDVVLNVDSKELSEDNLITQMKKSNRKIIFFGDDTWIKLFPKHFVRHDGTTSFFVTDYTEVDNNVTRHVHPEMAQNDWDVMILHYLGLDHIGHLAGPTSPLVRPKLIEMDQVIQLIYETILRQDLERNISTLMVLCGDHGMSDGGSHGGSSPAETTTPLVFISSLYEERQGKQNEMEKVNQIDLAPTLAVLFGLSIPTNSIGILIPNLLRHHSVKERLEALRMNSLQIFEVYESNTDNESVVELDLAARLHKEWLKDYENKSLIGIDMDGRSEQISKLYLSGMQVMSQKLTKFMSSYDFYALYIGIWLLVQSLLGSVCFCVDLLPQDFSMFLHLHMSALSITFLVIASLTGCIHVHLCSTPRLGTSEVFCVPSMLSFLLTCFFILSTAITLLGLMSVLVSIITFGLPTWIYTSPFVNIGTSSFLVFGLILHNISLLSTSFIEEEHQTWYFLTMSYHLILFYKTYLESRGTSYFSEVETSTNNTIDNTTPSTRNLASNAKNKSVTKNHVARKTEHSIKRTLPYMLVLLWCNRTLRSWNQTGIKWAGQSDVEDWLLIPENKTVLSLLTAMSLVGITLSMYYKVERNHCDLLEFVIFAVGAAGVYLYRAAMGCVNLSSWSVAAPQVGIQFAQLVHVCVFVLVLKSLFQFLYCVERKGYITDRPPGESLVTAYVLLMTLLLRTHNIALVALMLLQAHVHRKVIWERCESNVEIILSAYYAGWFTYFAQGNSNSLATVDIGAGYTGLEKNYWPGFVGLLTFLATFSGPLFWLLRAVIFIQSKHNCSNRSSSMSGVGQVCAVLMILKSFNLTVCTILSWLNCYHLFIWSVFSPKLLYEGVVSLVIGVFILAVSAFIKI